MRTLIFTAFLAVPTLTMADINVQFIEGAPKDRFVIAVTGCPLPTAQIALDLGTAPAGLIFDVTASGAGVEVFQPVELVSGQASMATVTDGDQVLLLDVPGLTDGAPVTISADIDDTMANSASGQIIVRGSEIAGASVRVMDGDMTYTGTFDEAGMARVAIPGCIG